jgi:hypothetical protein
MGATITILGPVGVAAYMLIGVMAFHREINLASLAGAVVQAQLPIQLTTGLLAAHLGALCGAVGFFIATFTLVLHFLESRHLPKP